MSYVLTLSCQDQLAIVARVAQLLAKMNGFILESSQYGDASTGRFFLRAVFEYHGEHLSAEQFTERFQPLGAQLHATWAIHPLHQKTKTLLLVSKEGHCLSDLLHRVQTDRLPIDVAAIASNHRALEEIASWYKIPFHHLPVTESSKAEQEAAIYELIQSQSVELVVLARYMQILSPELTGKLAGKAINIHHSFLPSFKGAKPYAQAFERGVKLIGATAHYVSDALDEGPIIEQEVLRVDHTKSAQELAELGKDIEAQVLARAVRFHTQHRVFLNGHKTVVFR